MSKAYPQIQIKQYPDDQKGFEKPYLGYRRGGGMPSAREQIESFKLDHPSAYHGLKTWVNCAKNVRQCKKKCEFRTDKKSNGCSLHFNVQKCTKILSKQKIEKPDYKPPLKGKGIYDEGISQNTDSV